MKINTLPRSRPFPATVAGGAGVACTIPLERLQKLAASVMPLLHNEPVAVQQGGETCFYMVSPAMFSQLQMRLPLQESAQPSALCHRGRGKRLPHRGGGG